MKKLLILILLFITSSAYAGDDWSNSNWSKVDGSSNIIGNLTVTGTVYTKDMVQNNSAARLAIGTNAESSTDKINVKIDTEDTEDTAIRAMNWHQGGNNYGINGTAAGTGSTQNVAVYGWAEGATENIAFYGQKGDLKLDNGNINAPNSIATVQSVTTTATDGTHMINPCNTGAFSGTPAQGDITCRKDTGQVMYYDGSAWIGLVQRIYQSGAPLSTDCDADTERGRPDVLDTATGTLYICNGTSGWIAK